MTDKEQRIQQAIDEFNALGETEDFYGHTSRVYARRPILATDCDYEIVRISGVQGVKLPDLSSTKSVSLYDLHGPGGVYRHD